MDGESVLRAVSEICDCLEQAMGAASVFNATGFCRIKREDALAHWEKEATRHKLLDAKLRGALASLVETGYPVPGAWLSVSILTPQFAFADGPDEEPEGTVWVVGCAPDPETDAIAPAEFAESPLLPGELWEAAETVGHLHNPLCTATYDAWCEVLAEAREVERRLLEHRMAWPPSDNAACDDGAEGTAAGTDGPCGGCRWRHNGEVIEETLPLRAWRMVNHLWRCADRSATLDDLAPVVEDDHAKTPADLAENSFRGLQGGANRFFKQHGIPWRVSLTADAATLQPSAD